MQKYMAGENIKAKENIERERKSIKERHKVETE